MREVRFAARGRRRRAALALAALAAAGAAAPRAEEPTKPRVEAVTVVERLGTDADGAPAAPVELPPSAVPAPGDSLVYTVRFTNTSSGDVDDVRITKPIPPGVRYVAGSASGPGCEVLFSVDGGRTFGQPNELTVPAADGSRRAAAAEDYTHIRWRLKTPLPAGATGFARFRAVAR